MGIWGTGIFQDDTTADLKDLFVELTSLGVEPDKVLAALLKDLKPDGALEESQFWIALAILQHKYGLLTKRVRKKAISYIDSGYALRAWKKLDPQDSKSISARAKSLQKAKETITSPQPKKKKLRLSKELRQRVNPRPQVCPFEVGDVYAFKLSTGDYVVLIVSRIITVVYKRSYSREGDIYLPQGPLYRKRPYFILGNYCGKNLPRNSDLKNLKSLIQRISSKQRASDRKTMFKFRESLKVDLKESFESFKKKYGACHLDKSDVELRKFHLECLRERKKLIASYRDLDIAVDSLYWTEIAVDEDYPIPMDKFTKLNKRLVFPRSHDWKIESWHTLEKRILQVLKTCKKIV